jgi:hypothetical protein
MTHITKEPPSGGMAAPEKCSLLGGLNTQNIAPETHAAQAKIELLHDEIYHNISALQVTLDVAIAAYFSSDSTCLIYGLRRARAYWKAGEKRDVVTGARLKRMGVKLPDFILISPHGSVRLLELKRPGEKLSDPQEDFRMHCIRHGIAHAIAYDVRQALTALDCRGCLRIKIGGSR